MWNVNTDSVLTGIGLLTLLFLAYAYSWNVTVVSLEVGIVVGWLLRGIMNVRTKRK